MKIKFLFAAASLSLLLSGFINKPYFGEILSKYQTKTIIDKEISENLKEIDLENYFENVDGCAVFYSSKEDKYYAYNSDIINTRVMPCSTFKIVSALSGLENGIIKDENTVIRWDGREQMLEQWEQDLSLESAFRLSANWYFDKVDKEVGKEELKKILAKIDYGNMDLSSSYPYGESKLKISPIEQVEFIKKIFKNELSFKQENLEIIKKIMYIHTEKGKLYGKTGTSGTQFLESGNQTAWFVGKYDSGSDEVYFAVRILGDKNNKNIAGGYAQKIAQNIIEDMYN